MANPQLRQLEHELEVAAVQFSMAEQPLSHLSDADHAQSALVSEARVMDAALMVLATDSGASIERLLSDSVQHPMFGGSDRERWHRFLDEVRQQVRVERYAGRSLAMVTTPRSGAGEGAGRIHGRRWEWTPGPKAGAGALAVVVVLVLGAVLLAGASWISPWDRGCTGEDCSGGFDAVASNESISPSTAVAPTSISGGHEAAPSTSAQPNDSAGQATSETPKAVPADADRTATNPAVTETTAVSASTSPSTAQPSATTSTAPATTTTGTTPSTEAPTETSAVATTTTASPPDSVDASTTITSPASVGVVCPTGPTLILDVTGVASDDVLNIRLGPGTSFDPIYGLPNGASAQVFDGSRSGSWVMVVVPEAAAPKNCGWSHSSFLATPITDYTVG